MTVEMLCRELREANARALALVEEITALRAAYDQDRAHWQVVGEERDRLRGRVDVFKAREVRLMEALRAYGTATGMGERSEASLKRLAQTPIGTPGNNEALAEIVSRKALSLPEPPLPAEVAELRERVKKLEEKLNLITEGAGPYSMDPLQHAANTIEAMKKLAQEALEKP